MINLAYNLVRLALLALALAFLSFYLFAKQGMQQLEPVVTNATKYLPTLLLPVSIAMAALLVLRYLSKGSDEAIGFEDFFAGLAALALQVVVLILWRAQGNTVVGELMTNIPDVPELTKHATTLGTVGVAAIQFVAFVLYVIAAPDRRERA